MCYGKIFDTKKEAEEESDIEGLRTDLYTIKKTSTKKRYGTTLLNTAEG